jgi:N-acetylneuraminic acid mutarotase
MALDKEIEELKEVGAASEFNKLAALICQTSDDNFVLNLFPEQASFGKNISGGKEDDNTIYIDLGKQQKDTRI